MQYLQYSFYNHRPSWVLGFDKVCYNGKIISK
ncbi:hypothetical protein OnM2_046077 [Erysiphe neolycopersici]|uniref:Uncharacterized protein n=1 Tax=Erysiphe neolycopersici TaxID=212602 RepID=A0A420HTY7_9PEZI|nr:hypothetical protein OnM2_046077 [Erysiphe neolycopersici]